MKVGDLVVHIGASPNAYRIRLVCHIKHCSAKSSSNNFIADTDLITFPDGTVHFSRQWVKFNGWAKSKKK